VTGQANSFQPAPTILHAMRSDADRIIDLYERHAHDWVSDRGRQLGAEGAWLARFTALVPHGARILDIGCGAGEPIARNLLEQGYLVDGVDSSPTLISLCRDRFPERSWHVADMRSLALGATFDGLLAWNSMFHLAHDDQRAMFSIFRQHAAPGAALMFTSGTSHGEAIGSFRGEPLYHASLSTEEYRTLLAAHGFRVVEHVAEDPEGGGPTVWLALLDRTP
jgi:SAM-dependent methyltransferase